MSTNPDPTPPPSMAVAGAKGSTAPSGAGLPDKLNQLRESINELQQLLSELTDALNASGQQPKA